MGCALLLALAGPAGAQALMEAECRAAAQALAAIQLETIAVMADALDLVEAAGNPEAAMATFTGLLDKVDVIQRAADEVANLIGPVCAR